MPPNGPGPYFDIMINIIYFYSSFRDHTNIIFIPVLLDGQKSLFENNNEAKFILCLGQIIDVVKK